MILEYDKCYKGNKWNYVKETERLMKWLGMPSFL